MSVTDIKELAKTDKYRITLCNVSVFGLGEEMERLELRIKGGWVFVRNFYHVSNPKNFGKCSEALRKGKEFAHKKGWFGDYGQGSPLDQFKDSFKWHWDKKNCSTIKDFSKLDSQTVVLTKYGHIWAFGGNHETISNAFWFLIWDKKLVKKIRKIMLSEYNGYECTRCSDIVLDKKSHIELNKEYDLRRLDGCRTGSEKQHDREAKT